MEILFIVCAYVGAFWMGFRMSLILIFIVAGRKLKITVTDKNGDKRSTIIKYRPLDSVHRDLLKVKWHRLKTA